MSKTETAPTGSETVPRGGVWEKQHLYGGKRLQQEFAASEEFVLWAMRVVGDVPMQDGNLATKTELVVSRLTEPETRFEVNTLSDPIAKMAPEAQAGDFPVVAYWSEVDTSRNMNPAVVLTAVRAFEA